MKISRCFFYVSLYEKRGHFLMICFSSIMHQSAVSVKAEVKKVARCQNATPQFQQQVAGPFFYTSLGYHTNAWIKSDQTYLEIVWLRAGFRSRQRVYRRFGHFDLHHLLRAQGGGMRTDMGYWRKQRGIQNTSECIKDSEEAAHSAETERKRPVMSKLSSYYRRKKQLNKEICVLH